MKSNQKLFVLLLAVVSMAIAPSCSDNNFASSDRQAAKKDKNEPANPKQPNSPQGNGPDQPQVGSPTPTPTPDNLPELKTDSGGLQIAGPDYAQCAALPSAGYAGSGKCGVNEVLVIINDGKSGGRTCCPIGKNVLSAVPAEVNQVRQGSCLADEVGTGILGMTSPYCTKINTQHLKLQSVGVAVYGTKGSAGALGALSAAYHIKDCCACPEGSVMIGGHTLSDNRCADQCVKIIKK